jgi:tRNA A-37 threonylcarbamoyl transferase component Bud32
MTQAVEPAAGQRLGQYDLLQRLAVGGMAEIYRACSTETGQHVVIKVLLPQFRRDAELRSMFADEGKLALRLEHENIVRVLEVGEGEPPYLVMEFVDGCTLSQLLKGQELSPGLCLFLIQGLLDALGYLHGFRDASGGLLEVVHRDLTPHNLMISRTGQIKLTDLGIARSRIRSDRTRTGVIKGTVQYMSPEQVSGDDIDHRSDIYGAGMLLFEMLCGEPYIHAAREVELLHIAQSPPWRPPSEVNSRCDGCWDSAVKPALMPYPEQRYQDAEAMREALNRLAEQLQVPAAGKAELMDAVEHILGPAPVNEVAGEGGGPSRSRVLVPLMVGAVTVAVGVGVALNYGGAPVPHPLDASAAPVSFSTAMDAGQIGPDSTNDHTSVPVDVGSRSADTRRQKNVRSRRTLRATRRKSGPDAGVKDSRVITPKPNDALAKLQLMSAALAVIRADLKKRGIRIEDLGKPMRARLGAITRALKKGDSATAYSSLQELRSGVRNLAIDGPFIQRKIRRIDRRLRGLTKDSEQSRLLRQRASDALQSYMDGRFDKANVQLNKIIAGLNKK